MSHPSGHSGSQRRPHPCWAPQRNPCTCFCRQQREDPAHSPVRGRNAEKHSMCVHASDCPMTTIASWREELQPFGATGSKRCMLEAAQARANMASGTLQLPSYSRSRECIAGSTLITTRMSSKLSQKSIPLVSGFNSGQGSQVVRSSSPWYMVAVGGWKSLSPPITTALGSATPSAHRIQIRHCYLQSQSNTFLKNQEAVYKQNGSGSDKALTTFTS
jgi:hypothetical protein